MIDPARPTVAYRPRREVPSLPVRSSSRVPRVGAPPPADWSGLAFLVLLTLSIAIEFAVGWGLLSLIR